MSVNHPTDVANLGFASLYHHDGRFIRRQGVFAFSRRDADGGHTVLHIERAGDISRAATPSHPRWDWAVSNGMNELLISMKESDTMKPEIMLSDLRFALHPEASGTDVAIAA